MFIKDDNLYSVKNYSGGDEEIEGIIIESGSESTLVGTATYLFSCTEVHDLILDYLRSIYNN